VQKSFVLCPVLRPPSTGAFDLGLDTVDDGPRTDHGPGTD